MQICKFIRISIILFAIMRELPRWKKDPPSILINCIEVHILQHSMLLFCFWSKSGETLPHYNMGKSTVKHNGPLAKLLHLRVLYAHIKSIWTRILYFLLASSWAHSNTMECACQGLNPSHHMNSLLLVDHFFLQIFLIAKSPIKGGVGTG